MKGENITAHRRATHSITGHSITTPHSIPVGTSRHRQSPGDDPRLPVMQTGTQAPSCSSSPPTFPTRPGRVLFDTSPTGRQKSTQRHHVTCGPLFTPVGSLQHVETVILYTVASVSRAGRPLPRKIPGTHFC
jgi:hypothetical protein